MLRRRAALIDQNILSNAPSKNPGARASKRQHRQERMKKNQILIIAGIVLLLAIATVVLFVLLRKPDVDPPPLIPSPSGSASTGELTLDAGEDADADADAAEGGRKPPKPGPDSERITRLIACCRVIAQNAASAGDPLTRGSMLQTAAVCEASAKSGNFDAVDAALRKYDVPCN